MSLKTFQNSKDEYIKKASRQLYLLITNQDNSKLKGLINLEWRDKKEQAKTF